MHLLRTSLLFLLHRLTFISLLLVLIFPWLFQCMFPLGGDRYDKFCPFYKSVWMMRNIIHFYNLANQVIVFSCLCAIAFHWSHLCQRSSLHLKKVVEYKHCLLFSAGAEPKPLKDLMLTIMIWEVLKFSSVYLFNCLSETKWSCQRIGCGGYGLWTVIGCGQCT